MTSFTSILRHANLLVILPFLFSCSTPQSINQEGKEGAIDMGSYTVGLPSGENWNVEIDKGVGSVRFLKQPKSLFGRGELPTTIIQVSYNWVVEEKMWQLSEEEIANDYRDGEIANMTMAGVLPGSYEVHDAKKDITTLDGKKLYTLSYKQMGGKWFGTDKISESILYIYFPSSFKETHTFYLFLISEIHKREKQIAADLTPIFQVIKSLRLK